MVDSIKRGDAAQRPSSAPNAKALRANFRSLSSGLKVPDISSKAVADVVADTRVRESKQVAKAIGDLNDALSFSRLALDSLGRVVNEDESGNEDGNVVQQFAEDIDKLKQDIAAILDSLRNRVDKGEVVQENITSAEARLDDVAAARDHAESAGAEITFNGTTAVEAHSNISPDAVADLLAE